MENIFISYKREQREWVSKLVLALESYGLSVWWDPKIDVGEEYFKVINSVIKKVDCILVIWSHDSVDSQWVMSEATVGMERNNIVPILRDEIVPPIPFNIIQSADLTMWNGDVNHEGFEQLLASIQKHCNVELSEKSSKPHVETEPVLPLTQSYSLFSSTPSTNEESKAWKEILSANQKRDYKEYLTTYPKGKHRKKALQKLRQLSRKRQLLMATLIVLKQLGV